MLINRLCNTSFMLIVVIVCIHNVRTTHSASTSKANSCAIGKSHLKHPFLADGHVDDGILKGGSRGRCNYPIFVQLRQLNSRASIE